MQTFKVKCYNAGVWDGKEPRDVQGDNEQDAAERICGAKLTDGGKPGQYRAEVWLPSKPGAKKCFYVPISN